MPGSRSQINADYEIVLYNALQIYFFRGTTIDFCQSTPPALQLVIEGLLRIVRSTHIQIQPKRFARSTTVAIVLGWNRDR